MSYRCNYCGSISREPAMGVPEFDQTTDAYGVRVRHYVCPAVCPECLSEDIVEFTRCDWKDCTEEALKHDDYCARHKPLVDAKETWLRSTEESFEMRKAS